MSEVVVQDIEGAETQTIPIMNRGLLEGPEVSRRKRASWLYLVVALLGFGIFFPSLGSFGLWDPWETHYGEVTRNIVETRDWIALKWGYTATRNTKTDPHVKWAHHNETWKFMSKPILIFWSQALSVKLFGYSEWAFRFPMALLAWLVMITGFHVLRTVTQDNRLAFLGSVVVATCPQFYMISRQAQTDMPFVGTLSLGMFMFLLALFRPRERISDRRFVWRAITTVLLLVLLIFPQVGLLVSDVPNGGVVTACIVGLMGAGVIVSIVLPILSHSKIHGRFEENFKDRWYRQLNLYLFYAFIGLATLAKGLLGFALPGAIIFTFILITWNWRLLLNVALIRGTLIFLAVTAPWYAGMFLVYGNDFFKRFIIHDHINRFSSGVHQVDTGLFEHFIKWLGIGMFPWSIFIPVVLISVFTLRRIPKDAQGQFKLFLFVWAFISYILFTKASTKFHHYIFPALVPLAMLIGIWLRGLPRLPSRAVRLAAIVGIGFTLSMGWTIYEDKQVLRNLMTYKYDRKLPNSLPVDPNAPVTCKKWAPKDKAGYTFCQDTDGAKVTWKESLFFHKTPALTRTLLTTHWGHYPNVIIRVVLGVILGLLLWLLIAKSGVWTLGFRWLGIGIITVSALHLTVWSLNVYMPMLSPSWSQRDIFETYFESCELKENPAGLNQEYEPLVCQIGLCVIADWTGARKKRECTEDIIAWLFTWRGETFYGNNTAIPVLKKKDTKTYLSEMNDGCTFYAILEDHQKSAFGQHLKRYSRELAREGKKPFDRIEDWNITLEHGESPFFVLMRAEPVPKTLRLPVLVATGFPGSYYLPFKSPFAICGVRSDANSCDAMALR